MTFANGVTANFRPSSWSQALASLSVVAAPADSYEATDAYDRLT